MTTQQFRAAITVMLAIVLAAGLYLGWHYTHRPAACPAFEASHSGC